MKKTRISGSTQRCAHCGHAFSPTRDQRKSRSPHYCSKDTKAWQLDHIVPVFRGGASKLDNLQVLCVGCHELKSAPEKAEASRQRHVAQKNGRWLTHYEKDQLIETLRAEIAALRVELTALPPARDEAPL